MRKKNGFISMTLVYTFLILFMFLMLAILRTYTEKDKFLQAINDQIDNDIGVAKGSRVTVINKILEDNMPVGDSNIKFFKISNGHYGNGNNLFYMEKKVYNVTNPETLPVESQYHLNRNNAFADLTDENADGHTSRMYYFRGDVKNNHLYFAGKCFRILRTNEDGSIRIVYNGPATGSYNNAKCKDLDDISSSTFMIKDADNHTNFQFNTTASVEYISSSDSNVKSPIIDVLNDWYKKTFIPSADNSINYTDFISKNTIFCNNKTSYLDTNYYQSKELAPIFLRTNNYNIYNDANIINTVNFKCENMNDRYGVNEGNLTYPVGLLTAQDIILAGGYLDVEGDQYHGGPDGVTTNESYFLYSSVPYWTMSPISNDGKMLYVDASGTLKAASATSTYAIRPVISLNQAIVIARGSGTANDPYIVRDY